MSYLHSIKYLKSIKQPLKNAKISGIYFLFKDDELVYIGQSIDIMNRIFHHRTNHNNSKLINGYNSYSYIRCEKQYLDYYEKMYINYYKPKHNKIYLERIPVKKCSRIEYYYYCCLPTGDITSQVYKLENVKWTLTDYKNRIVNYIHPNRWHKKEALTYLRSHYKRVYLWETIRII